MPPRLVHWMRFRIFTLIKLTSEMPSDRPRFSFGAECCRKSRTGYRGMMEERYG
jgi:hypothetical protein